MMRNFLTAAIFAAGVLIMSDGADAADVSLVKDGKPRSVILLPAKPGRDEAFAAKEIVDHIRKMSGAELQVLKGGRAPSGMIPIEIGLSLNPDVEKLIRARGGDPASFCLRATPQKIIVAGLSQEGTLFAAYELLERLGCRWFIPGDIGVVIPEKRTVALKAGETIQIPSFRGRHLQAAGDRLWKRRNRLGGFDAGGHGMHYKPDPKKHPDYYCQENGKPTHQLAVSNPEVMKHLIAWAKNYMKAHPKTKYLTMGPDDGAGFGSSPWDAGDFDPFHGKISVTDRYVKCFNLILKELQKDYPDVGIAFYSYAQYTRPPVREKPNPKILPVFAPIDVCRLHSIDNPICPERAYIKKLVDGWDALGVKQVYRGYFFNLADQGLPFSMTDQVKSEIPYYHKKGFIACRVECMPMWAHHAPSLYLATKLFWNADADPQAVLDDFFSKFYGPAAKPARAYFDLLEKSYRDADFHTGNIYDIPHILTPDVMRKLAGYVEKAVKAAGKDNVYAKRVAMLSLAQAYGQDNLDMIADLHAFRFKKALDAYKRAEKKIKEGRKTKPPVFWPHAAHYLKRFWADTVKSAAERVSDGNEIVAKLPDEWLFIKDPKEGGEKLGFMNPNHSTKDWKPLKTYSLSWSDQGLRYLKGEVWYRTTVKVPARFKGRKINLWFGGIDDKAEVWINGKKLECLKKGAAPSGVHWEFAATPAVRFGSDNVIVVKISNREVNELGTGGITEPAMLWAEK